MEQQCLISIVIPVFNGADSIAEVVGRVHRVFEQSKHEIILVDDGSADHSAKVCAGLVSEYQDIVQFVQLSRNFGEHSAVLAGLAESRGDFVAVLDDDGQNPPEELPRMIEAIRSRELDVIYGNYQERQHHWFRKLGSRSMIALPRYCCANLVTSTFRALR